MNNQVEMAAEWELLRQSTLEAIKSIDQRTTASPGQHDAPLWFCKMMDVDRALRGAA